MEDVEKTVNVTVNLTPDEFVDFGLHQSARGVRKMFSPTFMGAEILLFALLTFYLFTTLDPGYAFQLSATGLVAFALIYVTIIIVPFSLARSALRDNFKKNSSAGKEMRFSFTAVGFVYRAAEKETVRKWDEILKVTETGNVIGIFTAKASVYLIPKRCFENGDFKELREMICSAMPNEKLNFI